MQHNADAMPRLPEIFARRAGTTLLADVLLEDSAEHSTITPTTNHRELCLLLGGTLRGGMVEFDFDESKTHRDDHGRFSPDGNAAGEQVAAKVWQKAGSLEDARKQAKAHGVNDLQCDGCGDASSSLEKANLVMKSLSGMMAAAPALAERMAAAPPIQKLTYWASKYVEKKPGVVGNFKTGAILNVGTRHADSTPTNTMGAWGVDESVSGYVRHEYGHHIWDQLGDKEKKAWHEVYNAKTFSEKVGKYAGSHPEEGFAESLCAFTHPHYASGPQLPDAAHDYMKNLCHSRSAGA